jgi:ABC-type polar amino acid transport system ATPase subunit
MEAGDVMTVPTSSGGDTSGGPILRVRGLDLVRGARQILRAVSVEIAGGDIVALMGASGSGKTTLLRAMAGLEPFDRGSIDIAGLAVTTGERRSDMMKALRTRVGMVFQFHCLFEHMTAAQNVWLSPVHVHGLARHQAEQQAMTLLRQLGVEHRARALPRELSGGEAQRVAIARALATDPPVLLMDEPTASLDADRRAELTDILRALVARGRTLVIATHDADFAAATATRVIRVHDGRVIEPAPGR